MHTQWESLANTHILGIAPYEPGKPIEETEREYGVHDAIKLASNENPLPPSERVQQAIAAQLGHLNRYPDGSGVYLRQALAKKHGFTQDQIVLGNGSNELIELAVRTFLKPGDEAIVPHPSFVVYPMIVQASGGIRVMVMLREHRLDLEAMARAITPMTKMVFVANPNNPTATIVSADEVEAFMARVPERTIVIFDEAYIEFAMGADFPDTFSYIRQGRKVIVLRTFSKAASLAGLRVGYGVADADAISLMNRIRQPFNVNSLAQAAALAAVDDDSHVLECVRMIEAGRHFLYDEFTALGIRYVPSRANFILVDVGRSASDIYQRLLKEGVIVRPMTPFGMESALRVTVVGSTKRGIVAVAERLAATRPLGFLGSHPMAGSEKSGWQVARADLFRGTTVIVTPTDATEPRATKGITALWEALGARVAALDPETHDRTVAAISHLPHVAAWALVDAVGRFEPGALAFAARGFRDTTRIAASDPPMWRDVLLANADAVRASLGAFRAALDDLERLLAAGDAAGIEALLARLKTVREGVA